MQDRPLRRLVAYVVEPVAQLALLVREGLSLRTLLLNRFTVVVLVILAASAGATAYMAENDGNRLTGTVVTADGTPVANATVLVNVVGIENVINRNETVTDGDGQFGIEEYSGSGSAAGMELRIRVTTEDGTQSPTYFRHAYFPDQTMHVRLVLDR
ncbi:hypothetical protein ACFQL1_22755 [Halomicroarcula sp. GCM10025709]|uniref:hypothetical protein n=1 Tax=Haloarcula TaxID=2237 RepID=UPI0024C3F23B|nr:hypothetical protein [Halomicroarcula sp. YJ-61-S]